MSLAGCQINSIDVNFHLQKSLEILDTNSADKIQSKIKKGGGGGEELPYLMLIRVKCQKVREELKGSRKKFHKIPLNSPFFNIL